MTKARYGYVPFYTGATLETDARYQTRDGRHVRPRGRLVVTVDGSKPTEHRRELAKGKRCRVITRRQAEHAYGRFYVEETVDMKREACWA